MVALLGGPGALAFGALCVAASMPAQELRGTVLDGASRQPIPGAVLTLLDSAGARLGRNITNELGQYRVPATTAMRRMRVVRIGYRPADVRLPALDSAVVVLNVTMIALPTMLEAVKVSAGAQCSPRDDRLAALSLLEQARAGLLATVVAREAKPATMIRLRFRREMNGNSDQIARQEVRIDSSADVKASFQAVRSASDFVRYGFLRDTSGRETFFGPDAETLLDDGFRDGYCFHLRDRDRARPNQIGLAFVPAHTEQGVVGIDGTLWIDTAQKALREIDYGYLGLDRRQNLAKPGGHIAFRELANGIVLIDRWFFRLPGLSYDTVWSRNGVPLRRTSFYAMESGGEVAAATWPDGYSWKAALATLRLHLVDRAGKALAGTRLRLEATDYSARTDANGDLQIANILPGPYRAVVLNSTLATLGLTIPAAVKFVAVRDSTIRATLAVPTTTDYLRDACGSASASISADTLAAWLIGRVERFDGKPARDASWHAWRQNASGTVGITDAGDKTPPDGLFYYCGSAFHKGDQVKIEARSAAGEPWASVIITLNAPVTTATITLPPPKP